MLTLPPLAGWLVALPFWRKGEMILGNLVGTILIFGAGVALIVRESSSDTLATCDSACSSKPTQELARLLAPSPSAVEEPSTAITNGSVPCEPEPAAPPLGALQHLVSRSGRRMHASAPHHELA